MPEANPVPRSLADRAVELDGKATKDWTPGPDHPSVSAAMSKLDGHEGVIAWFDAGGAKWDPRANRDFACEARTLLPALARAYLEKDAECARLRAALIELGHAVLGCDGYPCRVESDPVGYAPEMLSAIKDLDRGVAKAIEIEADLASLRAALEKIKDNLDLAHRRCTDSIGKSEMTQRTADAQMHGMVLSCSVIAAEAISGVQS